MNPLGLRSLVAFSKFEALWLTVGSSNAMLWGIQANTSQFLSEKANIEPRLQVSRASTHLAETLAPPELRVFPN
eukprot:760354-Rhodomonas_salina.2